MASTKLRIPSLILVVILANFYSVFSDQVALRRITYSSKGRECTSPCETKGESYHWCDTVVKKWDYCSTSPRVDYKGNKCQDKCGLHGKRYQWCSIEDGGWGYCSGELPEISNKIHFGAKEGKQCSSKCEKNGKSYFWCRTEGTKWDYCSPNKGLNSAGTKCKTLCAKGEVSYTWCNDENDKWQYCGPVTIIEEEDRPIRPLGGITAAPQKVAPPATVTRAPLQRATSYYGPLTPVYYQTVTPKNPYRASYAEIAKRPTRGSQEFSNEFTYN